MFDDDEDHSNKDYENTEEDVKSYAGGDCLIPSLRSSECRDEVNTSNNTNNDTDNDTNNDNTNNTNNTSSNKPNRNAKNRRKVSFSQDLVQESTCSHPNPYGIIPNVSHISYGKVQDDHISSASARDHRAVKLENNPNHGLSENDENDEVTFMRDLGDESVGEGQGTLSEASRNLSGRGTFSDFFFHSEGDTSDYQSDDAQRVGLRTNYNDEDIRMGDADDVDNNGNSNNTASNNTHNIAINHYTSNMSDMTGCGVDNDENHDENPVNVRNLLHNLSAYNIPPPAPTLTAMSSISSFSSHPPTSSLSRQPKTLKFRDPNMDTHTSSEDDEFLKYSVFINQAMENIKLTAFNRDGGDVYDDSMSTDQLNAKVTKKVNIPSIFSYFGVFLATVLSPLPLDSPITLPSHPLTFSSYFSKMSPTNSHSSTYYIF